MLRIVPDDTKFDFMRFRRVSFPSSAVLSIVAICLYFFVGLNFGIDFVGGTLLEVKTKSGEQADLSKMRTSLDGLGLGEIQLQEFGTPDRVLIRIPQQPGGEAAQNTAKEKVKTALGDELSVEREEVVGPRISTEMLATSTIGLMTAILAILVYLWFRFEWQFALGAMVANVHDLVLTIGYMSLMQIDFDLSSIAALLTILGYSTLSRSIVTHVTVTLSLLALLLFGGHAIHSFVATMIFGVVLVGTYTSVFIAAPILIYLGVGTTRAAAEEPAEPAEAAKAAKAAKA
jgi:preprotein translocase subunit SecF